jgi:hypothetical protein
MYANKTTQDTHRCMQIKQHRIHTTETTQDTQSCTKIKQQRPWACVYSYNGRTYPHLHTYTTQNLPRFWYNETTLPLNCFCYNTALTFLLPCVILSFFEKPFCSPQSFCLIACPSVLLYACNSTNTKRTFGNQIY